MSYRVHFADVKSSAVQGDVISVLRDNDTNTYRVFAHKGWRDVQLGNVHGCRFDSCECCDLTIEDLQRLSKVLESAIAAHTPWMEPQDDDPEN